MKAAIIQMRVKAGKCEENMAVIRERVADAKKQGCDLIVFPQNAVSGYLLGDRWLDEKWCAYVDHFNEEIIALAKEIAIVWGNVKYRHGHLFNCAFFAFDKETHMRVKRNERGGYGDDGRYFEENAIHDLIEYRDHLFSLQFHHDYMLADWAINIDCDAYCFDETKWVPKGNTLYVNPIGMQNCGKHVCIYQGGSGVYQNKQWKRGVDDGIEGMCIVELDETITPKERKQQDLFAALCNGIRYFDEELLGGKLPWIIGLSGGLDSSVSAALLTKALGKERVYGYHLATCYNSKETIDHAEKLARTLGIHYAKGNIELLRDATSAVMKQYGYDETKWPSLVKENIQARLRGHLLSTFASVHGGVVANNGNKVELALGYCTLYGDAIGALSLLGDLSKVTLFQLSKQINSDYQKEVIPSALLPRIEENKLLWEVMPSAELANQQRDPMKWFYHDYLIDHRHDFSIIELMERYASGEIKDHALYRWIVYYGLDDPKAFIEDLDWFCTTMRRNAFKQLQVPPLLVVSKHAFSAPFAQGTFDEARYEKWKQLILARAKKAA